MRATPTVWLNELVPYSTIRNLSDARKNIEFVKFHQGTVFEIKKEGFDEILKAILDFNPTQTGEIKRFLS